MKYNNGIMTTKLGVYTKKRYVCQPEKQVKYKIIELPIYSREEGLRYTSCYLYSRSHRYAQRKWWNIHIHYRVGSAAYD